MTTTIIKDIKVSELIWFKAFLDGNIEEKIVKFDVNVSINDLIVILM